MKLVFNNLRRTAGRVGWGHYSRPVKAILSARRTTEPPVSLDNSGKPMAPPLNQRHG